MESQNRRSTLRSNRKPLSDCTNILPTLTRRKYPNPQTLIKPPKPVDSTANSNVKNKLPNPPPAPPTTCSSPKSYTSTGSNNSPASVSIPSIPLSQGITAPPNSHSDTSGKDGKKPWLSGDQSQKHDATTRKDKGKMVADAPIIHLSASMTSNSLRISSHADPDYSSRFGIQSAQRHEQTIKDKGKAVVGTAVIESPATWKSKYMHSTSPFTSNDSLSETSAVHSRAVLEETRKDKGKEVVETPNNKDSEPSTQHAPLASLAASGDQSQRHDATIRKDKGKMVADAPIIHLSASITSNSLLISSPADPDYSSQFGIQSAQRHEQTIKDKGKAVVGTAVIESPATWKSKYMHSTSPFTSNDSLSETSAVHSRAVLEETRKYKGKGVIETPNIKDSEPSTPHAPLASLAASGTSERPVTVYNQRRVGRGRKHAIVKSNVPLTCPPDQRKKKKGLELDYDQYGDIAGSHTDPLPMHKMKRSRKIDDGLLKEEVETLRARYAEIDADKLLEEEVSEDDLE